MGKAYMKQVSTRKNIPSSKREKFTYAPIQETYHPVNVRYTRFLLGLIGFLLGSGVLGVVILSFL